MENYYILKLSQSPSVSNTSLFCKYSCPYEMDINHDRLVQVLCVAEALGVLQEPVQRPRRKHWVHPINNDREISGRFFKFFNDIRQYPEKFFIYYRMSIKSFDELLQKIQDQISKKHTPWRNPLSAEERLTITLRYLSTGMTFTALHFEFKIGKSTVSQIVRETCNAIWNILRNEEMPEPTIEHWLEISNTFYSKTDFPNCLGAVDGKHIRIQNPKNTGSLFFNYKKYFSIILMAVVDANLNFVYIDVGSYGKESDSNIFKESSLGKKLYSNAFNIPDPVRLPNSQDSPQPYVFVGDEAFALHTNLLRPYPQRGLNNKRKIFNYRLSRARRTVECAFGVLANKWRVLHTTILVSPEFVDDIVKSCCVLHNFVRKRDGCNLEDVESECNLDDIEVRGTGSRSNGIETRNAYAEYFLHEGAVPFQNRVI